MKIFVTGGAGFIGSNFCEYVLEQDQVEHLCILDNFTYAGLVENLVDVLKDPRTQLIHGDLCEAEKYKSEIWKADTVFNFAAESHVDNSISSPEEFMRTNILGTFQLLEVVRKARRPIRYIQVSTDEVYGSLNFDQSSSKEDSPLQPSSPYSASKAGADHFVMSYERTYNIDVVVTRSSNNYGPRQLPEKFIPKIISNAFLDKKIPVYGQGKNVRDWIYVRDNCVGIWLASLKGRKGHVYHFASQNELSNIDLAKQILKHLDKSEDLIEYVFDRPGHDLRYSLNTTKTQSDLCWRCKESLESGLKKTLSWYKDHSDWIQIALKKIKSIG